MTCILHGPCVDVALQGYKGVANGSPPFVVFQYVRALPREKGVVLLLYFQFVFIFFSGFYNVYVQGFQRLPPIWMPRGFSLTCPPMK